MAIQTEQILKNLETARRLSFPDFENIVLQPEAIKVLVNLFLHPGCKADINLATFLTGQPVPLTKISPHIITAFPSQIASYAAARGRLLLSASDLLECFALDHADAVEENAAALGFNPAYALSHVLTIGTVTATRSFNNRQLADIRVLVCNNDVYFNNVLVPSGMAVRKGARIFHHFGVIVAAADTKKMQTLSKKLQTRQDQHTFMQNVMKKVIGKNKGTINFSSSAVFSADMTGKILVEMDKRFDFHEIWQEEDLKNIKLPGTAQVMFQS